MTNSADAVTYDPSMGNANNHISSISANINATQLGQAMKPLPDFEPVEWAKFCMWLRGYLAAIEGKELTAEDTAKVMEKLATVDPESHNWQYNRGRTMPPPYLPPLPPSPQWTFTTTDGTNEAAMAPKIMCGKP